MCLGFAGETYDEGRADGDARNAATDFLDQIDDVLLARLAPHRREHFLVDVLQRHVDVTRDLRAGGDGLDQLITPVRGMRVEQPNPEIALDGVQLPQQRAQRRIATGWRAHRRAAVPSRIEVETVECGVLRNEIEFAAAVGHEVPALLDDVLRLTAPVFATDLRDDANAARMID